MRKLTIRQRLVLYFAIGLFFGYLLPFAGLVIFFLMVIIYVAQESEDRKMTPR